jgi:MFS family permease
VQGWVNLVLAAVAMSATLPGRTHGLGLITSDLLRDIGVDAETWGRFNAAAVLLGAVLCLPVGRLIDRFGTRTMLALVAVGLGVGVVWLSRVTERTGLFASLTLVRTLGQSGLSVVSLALVGKWFTRDAGPAMGVYAMLVSIGSIAAYAVLLAAIGHSGWRDAWEGMGWTLMALAPVGLLLARSVPPAERESRPAPTGLADTDFTLRQALACPAFWAFGLATALFNLVWSAVTLFQQQVLDARGLGRDTSEQSMMALVTAGMLSNLVSGWLANRRVSLGRLLTAGLVMLAAALAAFPAVSGPIAALLYGAAMGVAGGPIVVVFFAVWGQAFGRTHLGKIQGAAQGLTVVASALGQWLLPWSRDATGSYEPFFFGAALAAAAFAAVVALTSLPRSSFGNSSGSAA